MFLDFFGIDDERRLRVNDGVYQQFIFGATPEETIQIIVLDTRYAKSEFIGTGKDEKPFVPDTMSNATTDKQILSSQQWHWLEEALQRPAAIRLVVSSFQALNGAANFECWGQLPHERTRLHALLKEHSDSSLVMILSGDRHVGAFYEFDGIHEVTSSSWTHTVPYGAFDDCTNAEECDEKDERRLGDFVRENHYGMMEVDWQRRTATFSLRRTEMSPHYKYTKLRSSAGLVLQTRSYDIPS